MPRFYFDFRRNGETTPDEDGVVLPDLATARAEGTPALLQMAKEKEPGEPFALCAIIRDGNRQPVWELESLVRMSLVRMKLLH